MLSLSLTPLVSTCLTRISDKMKTLFFNIGDFNNRVINSVKANNYSHISSLNRDDTEVISHDTKSRMISKSNKIKNKTVTFADTPLSQKTIDIGNTDLAMPNIFQSSNRHTDVSPEDVSERWFISIQQAKDTINRTT